MGKVQWLLCWLCFPLLAWGQDPALILEKELAAAKTDTQKLRLMTDLHWICLYTNPARARQLAETQIAMSKGKPDRKKQLAQGYNDLGLCEQVDFKWMEAIRWHQMAYQIRKEIRDDYGQASSLSKMAVSYGEMGDYSRCLAYNLKALPLFEKLDQKPALARIYGNLAANYTWVKQWTKADSMARLAARLSGELGDSLALAQAWTIQAQVRQQLGDLTASIDLNTRSLRIFEHQEDTAKMLATLNNLAYDFGLLNQVEKSRDLYRKALRLAEESQSEHDQIQFAANLASKELDLGHDHEAIVLLQRAEKLSGQLGNHQFLPQVYRSRGLQQARLGHAEAANFWYMKASSMQDSLLSDKFARQYALYHTAYDLEKKAHENEVLLAESQLKDAQLDRQRLGMITAGLVMGLVLLAFYFIRKQQQLKIRQKEEAERHAQQEKLAREILSAEEKERTRIARELHDGVGQQLVAAFLNLENLSNEMPGNTGLEDARSLVEDSLQEIRSVSHAMLSNALLRSGLAGAVRDFVQKVKTKMAIHLEVQDLEQRLDPTLELVLFRILQELVGNVIRHANASEVFIQLFIEDDVVVLLVEDNGLGFQPGQLKSEGVGLQNIRSRVGFLGGKLEIDSRPGKGCMAVVRVPVLPA